MLYGHVTTSGPNTEILHRLLVSFIVKFSFPLWLCIQVNFIKTFFPSQTSAWWSQSVLKMVQRFISTVLALYE